MDLVDTQQKVDIPKGVYEVEEGVKRHFDYSPRALWLRAVVLGVHEGSTLAALFLMGQASGTGVHHDHKAMLVTGVMALLAGAATLAVAEFVSVYTQYDIMKFQAKRDAKSGKDRAQGLIPSPTIVAISAGATHLLSGSFVLLAAGFIRNSRVRHIVAAAMASLSILVAGSIGAVLGRVPIVRSCARVLIGGWLAISIIWGKSQVLQELGV